VSSQDPALLDFMTSRTLEAVIFEARRRGSVALEVDDIHQDHFSAALHTMHHTHSLKNENRKSAHDPSRTSLKGSRFLSPLLPTAAHRVMEHAPCGHGGGH